MKVYISYVQTQCQNPFGETVDCPYFFHVCMPARDCPYFRRVTGDDPLDEDECQFLNTKDVTMCQERKSIEIVKGLADGYVKIGRKEIPLNCVELLKVDYGEGFVTEWDVHNLAGEED